MNGESKRDKLKRDAAEPLCAESPRALRARKRSVSAAESPILPRKTLVHCQGSPFFHGKEEDEENHNTNKVIMEEDDHPTQMNLGCQLCVIRVALDGDLFTTFGSNLVDFTTVRRFWISRWRKLNYFKKMLEKELHVPVECQRIWLWEETENHAWRVRRYLKVEEEDLSISHLRLHKVFLEVRLDKNGRPTSLPKKNSCDILIFFKYYDATREDLKYVGRLLVKRGGSPADILGVLNALAGLSCDGEIDLYSYGYCYTCFPIEKNETFHDNGLKDGDVVCFQRSVACSAEIKTGVLHPNFPTFIESLGNCKHVGFYSMNEPKENIFTLELPLTLTYVEVQRKVARYHNVDDPNNIRFTSAGYIAQPGLPIEISSISNFSDMMQNNKCSCDILYYEVLKTPLPEKEKLRTLQILVNRCSGADVGYEVVVPKEAGVEHVLRIFKEVAPKCNDYEAYIFFRTDGSSIYHICTRGEKIDTMADDDLRAQVVRDRGYNFLLNVCHFREDANTSTPVRFGVPFVLSIDENDKLSDVKVMIKDRLQVNDDDFSKLDFALLDGEFALSLHDLDDIISRFKEHDFMLFRSTFGKPKHLGIRHYDQ